MGETPEHRELEDGSENGRAYESGRKVPSVDTLGRLLRAAGFEPMVDLVPAPDDRRGEELIEALDLAAQFPARHSRTLRFPRFGAA